MRLHKHTPTTSYIVVVLAIASIVALAIHFGGAS